MVFYEVNPVAVIVASVCAFHLGAYWYSPVGFLDLWEKESGEVAPTRHGARTLVVSYLSVLLASYLFARVLPHGDLMTSMISALTVGVGFVATAFGLTYKFAGKSFKHFLIDGMFHIFQFLIFGLFNGLLR